jgi:hypothetical protein
MSILPKITLDDFVQCNPHKYTNDILQSPRPNNPKIHVGIQKTPNIQSNLEQNEQN